MNLKNLSLLIILVLLEGDLMSSVYVLLLQPITTSQYSLCSEV